MLPEGEYLYEDLSSEFVDRDKFLSELKEKEITGYIEFKSPKEHGFGLIEMGEPQKMKRINNGDERLVDGSSALQEILSDGDYTMNVVELNESSRDVVRIKLGNKELKTDITPGEVDIANFLSTNITDQGNDCHLIVIDDGECGIVTMENGYPVEAKYSAQKEVLFGDDAFSRIVDELRGDSCVVDIYDVSGLEVEGEADTGAEEMDMIEEELRDVSEGFGQKADDLLDDMGLDFLAEDEGEDEGPSQMDLIEDELKDVGDDFMDKADDLVDDMGLGGLGEEEDAEDDDDDDDEELESVEDRFD